MNLLSNSMKFTEPGGKICLSVREKDGINDISSLTFEVTDTGKGMSKEFMSRIFTPFEQESSSTARKYGGSGLGLSITKNLVNLMGGSIEVASEEGKGSCFTIVIPFKIDEASPKEVPALKDFSSLRALIIDDDENEGEYARSILKRLKIRSDIVYSGEEGLNKIIVREEAGRPYDFCLMDWKMPGQDGIVTSEQIRAKTKLNLPIIMLTAYDADAIRSKAKASGVNVVIAKPLFESTLFDLLVSMYGSYDVGTSNDDHSQGASFAGVKVLLAEDNDMNLEIAKNILEKRGISITVARDGREAVNAFLNGAPGYFDAILMDIQMPNLDGYEATREIRASSKPDAKLIPIIAMTADAFNSDVSMAISSGMNDHVAKPIDKERLFKVLSEQIDKYRRGNKSL